MRSSPSTADLPGNVVAYTTYGISQWSPVWPGHPNIFRSNTVILRGDATEYAVFDSKMCFGAAGKDQRPLLGSNSIYTRSGNATICGMTLIEYQAADAQGNDPGSKAIQAPPDGATASHMFLEAARIALGMPSPALLGSARAQTAAGGLPAILPFVALA